MHAILVSLIPKLDVPHSGTQRLAGLVFYTPKFANTRPVFAHLAYTFYTTL